MGPTRPSARRPRRCWKVLTASSVLSLKTPSMPLFPRSKPSACRRVWRSTTSLPLSPLRSVRTYPTGLPAILAQCSSRPTRERRASGPGAPESRLLLFPLALDDLDERPLSQRLELHPFDLLVSSDSCTAPRATTGLIYPAPRSLCARDCNRECCSWQLQAELCR